MKVLPTAKYFTAFTRSGTGEMSIRGSLGTTGPLWDGPQAGLHICPGPPALFSTATSWPSGAWASMSVWTQHPAALERSGKPLAEMCHSAVLSRGNLPRDTRLAQSEECATLDLVFVSSSPTVV